MNIQAKTTKSSHKTGMQVPIFENFCGDNFNHSKRDTFNDHWDKCMDKSKDGGKDQEPIQSSTKVIFFSKNSSLLKFKS